MARPRNKRTFGEIQERLTKQGKKFYPRYSLPGVAERFSPGVGFTSYELAARWLDTERELWEKHVAAGTEHEWLAPTARRAAAQAQRERDSVTVGDMLGKWIAYKSRGWWEETTRQTNQQQVNSRLLEIDGDAGVFRSLPLSKVTGQDVRNWWAGVWSQFPKTRPTNLAARKHVSAAFKWAVSEELIPANPVGDLPIPSVRVGDAPARVDRPTREELQAILHHVPKYYRFPTALALFHGMRTQEVLGLRRWQVKRSVDDEGTVSYVVDLRDRKRVRAAVKLKRDGRHQMVEKGLKTDTSYRAVPVFAEFVDMLEEHMSTYAGAGAEGLVAVTRTGERPLDSSWNSVLKRAAKKAAAEIAKQRGLSEEQAKALEERFVSIRKHDGRRFIATELLESGTSEVAAGAFIGDRNPDVLREHYLRHTDEHLATGLQAVGERLKGAAGE
ncbi:hypothetical protein ACT3SZ_14400 [Corynebacterium sp. AOP40-9SA-29]|uniref:hypothetical protein n=1 Tax=Corynebacterium sp. AOP40-9SA-29 TaxID=3457677 RepID=UPI004034157D